MSQLPEGRPPTVTQVRPGSRQPSTQSHFHAEPVFLVRQSTGSSSHLETSPVCKRGLGIQPFAHRSGISAMLGEQQKQQEQQCPSPLVRSPNCHGKQDPGPSKQALPCASGSRPKGVFPSGGSSAVTFLHVLGRQGRGPCWHPQGSSTFDRVSFFILQPSRHLRNQSSWPGDMLLCSGSSAHRVNFRCVSPDFIRMRLICSSCSDLRVGDR